MIEETTTDGGNMRIGFTGTRSVPENRLDDVHLFLKTNTQGAVEYTTGCCLGFDALAAAWLLNEQPHGTHRICVPANRSQIDHWTLEEFTNPSREIFKVVEIMPDGTDYRYRNKRIVQHSDIVLALAEYPEDHPKSKRSGTWMTVRLARAAGIPVRQLVLNRA